MSNIGNYRLADNAEQFEFLRRNNYEVHYSCENKSVNFELLRIATQSIKKYEQDGQTYYEITWSPFLNVPNNVYEFIHSPRREIEVDLYESIECKKSVFKEIHYIRPISSIMYNLSNDSSDRLDNINIKFIDDMYICC